jgi:hypothetical protein
MNRRRFRAAMDDANPSDATPPAPGPGAFFVCPVVLCQGMAGPAPAWPQVLYYLAFQQAQAVHQPSLLQRQLSPTPN